jgi:hypothetical protein
MKIRTTGKMQRLAKAERKKVVEEFFPAKKKSKGFFVENAPLNEGAVSERPDVGKEDKNLTQIDQFYGTTQYYNVMGTRVTDGVKYLMDNGYSWSVTDAVGVLQAEPKVMGEEFVSIKLKRNATGGCVIRYEDGNEKLLYQQKYDYTDAKVDVQMFYENGVLLLPSEH